jgi:hypothetical protein
MHQKQWFFYSIIACSQFLIADSYQAGQILPKEGYSGGYNVPANISLNPPLSGALNCLGVEATFLYLNAKEEGLDLASSASMVQVEDASFATTYTGNGQILKQSSQYKPAFNVGISAGFGTWSLEGEYTWIRQTTHTSKDAPNTSFGIPVWNANDWFQQMSSRGQRLAATHVFSKWHLAIDMADLYVKRAAYNGRHLILSPFAGLRALWIRQGLAIDFTEQARTRAYLSAQPIQSYNHSNSWGLGPRIGLEGAWLLGAGLRLETDVTASLLGTKYTKIFHSEEAASTGQIPSQLTFSMNDYTALRTVLEMGLGLGFGSYICGQKYFIDLFASYDFSAYYSQNMMRRLMDQVVAGTSSGSDLYLQGFSFKASFKF